MKALLTCAAVVAMAVPAFAQEAAVPAPAQPPASTPPAQAAPPAEAVPPVVAVPAPPPVAVQAAAPVAPTPTKVGPQVCAEERGGDFVEPEPLPAGLGRVIFFRASRLQGAGVSFRVRSGELEYCTLGNGTYFVVDLAPGAYSFDTRGEVKDVLPLEIEPGETYYVEGRLGMAVVTMRPNLSPSTAGAFDRIKARLNHSRH